MDGILYEWIDNPRAALDRYVDLLLRQMELEGSLDALGSYTPSDQATRQYLHLRRRIRETAQQKQVVEHLLQDYKAFLPVTMETVQEVFKKHGLPIPEDVSNIPDEQVKNYLYRQKDRLFQQKARLESRLAQSPLSTEAADVLEEIMDIKRSGLLHHAGQDGAFHFPDSKHSRVREIWEEKYKKRFAQILADPKEYLSGLSPEARQYVEDSIRSIEVRFASASLKTEYRVMRKILQQRDPTKTVTRDDVLRYLENWPSREIRDEVIQHLRSTGDPIFRIHINQDPRPSDLARLILDAGRDREIQRFMNEVAFLHSAISDPLVDPEHKRLLQQDLDLRRKHVLSRLERIDDISYIKSARTGIAPDLETRLNEKYRLIMSARRRGVLYVEDIVSAEKLIQRIEQERSETQIIPSIDNISHQDEARERMIKERLEDIIQIEDESKRRLALDQLKAEVGTEEWMHQQAIMDNMLSRDATEVEPLRALHQAEAAEIRATERASYPRPPREGSDHEWGAMHRGEQQYRRSRGKGLQGLAQTPEEIIGSFIHRKSGRSAREFLVVEGIRPGGPGQSPTLMVRPFFLSPRKGTANIYVHLTPQQIYDQWYGSYLRGDVVPTADTSAHMRYQQALERVRDFEELKEFQLGLDYRRLKVYSESQPGAVFTPEEIFSQLMDTKYASSSHRIGGSGDSRVPRHLRHAIERNYPILQYLGDQEGIIDEIIQEASVIAMQDKRIMQPIPNAQNARKTFMEEVSRILDASVHQATGRVLGQRFSVSPGKSTGEMLVALNHISRIFRERGEPMDLAEVRRFIGHLRLQTDEKIRLPRTILPLIDADITDSELMRLWRIASSDRSEMARSIDAARESFGFDVSDEQVLEGYLDAIEDIQSELAEQPFDDSPLSHKVHEALDIDHEASEMLERIIDEADASSRAERRRARGDTFIPPGVRDKKRARQWLRFVSGVEGLGDPSEILDDAEIRKAFLDFSEGILGRPLKPREVERLTNLGFEELERLIGDSKERVLYKSSLDQIADMERIGLFQQGGEILIEHEGKRVVARLERVPGQDTDVYEFIIPSTGAKIQVTDAGDPQLIPVPAEELHQYEVSQRHPLFGSRRPMSWSRGPIVASVPHSPRMVAPLGYGVGEVLESARRLREEIAVIGALDIETTGLPEHYQMLKMERYFQPTEIGLVSYDVSDQGRMHLRSQERIVISPSQDMELHIRRMAQMTPEEFIAEQVRLHGDDVAAAARQVHQQSLRSYAALADPAYLDPTAKYNIEQLQATALRGLELANLAATEGGVVDPGLGQVPSMTRSQAMSRYGQFVEELAAEAGEAHIIAANAVRAEATWLQQFGKGRKFHAKVHWHDPQPIYRLINPDDRFYNLGHIARQLGIEHDSGQLHSALYDAVLGAEAYGRLATSEQMIQGAQFLSGQNVIEKGRLLYQTDGGARSLFRVTDVHLGGPGEEARVTLERLLGSPMQRSISGANLGEVERKLEGRYVPVSTDVDEGYLISLQRRGREAVKVRVPLEDASKIADMERDYWIDRARRDIQKGFGDPSSEIFDLIRRRGGEPDMPVDQLLRRLDIPEYATAEGRRVYRDTVRRFIAGAEGHVHGKYFHRIGELLEEGVVSHYEAGELLGKYRASLMADFAPMRMPSLHEATVSIPYGPEGRTLQFPISSPQAVQRSLIDTAYDMARQGADFLTPEEYLPLKIQELQRGLGGIAPSPDADLDQIAQAIFRHGRELYQAGELEPIADISLGFLQGEGRYSRAKEIMAIHDSLLKDHWSLLEASRSGAFAGSPLVGGMPFRDAVALAEGHASPITPLSHGEWISKRREVWRNIADRAFSGIESEATTLAREFLGLGTGDLGTVRLPFDVQGHFGLRLGDLTPEALRDVKSRVAPSSVGYVHGSEMYNIIRRHLAERRTAGIAAAEAAGRTLGQAPSSTAQHTALQVRSSRGPGWAGIAGAAALGLFALGSISQMGFRETARQTDPLPPGMGSGQLGLDIEVRGRHRGNVDANSMIHSAVMGVQQHSAIPLEVQVHQVDDTRSVNRHWAKELLLKAIQS